MCRSTGAPNVSSSCNLPHFKRVCACEPLMAAVAEKEKVNIKQRGKGSVALNVEGWKREPSCFNPTAYRRIHLHRALQDVRKPL